MTKGSARYDQDKKKFKGNCFNCGKYEHPANRCRLKKRGGRANQAGKTQEHEGEDSLITISALVCLIEKMKEWYLDSGATAHMCNNRDAFENLSNGPIG